MSLQTRLAALITAIGTDIKSLQTQINGLSAGSGAVLSSVTVTVDAFGQATVTDALVTSTSKISVTPGKWSPTDENDPDMDPVIWSCISTTTGSFVVLGVPADRSNGPIRGSFKINYLRS